MTVSKRIPTDGGQIFGHNPFAALSNEGLPPAPENPPAGSAPPAKPVKKHRGRVDILRVKAGQIEIQGDKRAEVARILTEANFHPVFAGG